MPKIFDSADLSAQKRNQTEQLDHTEHKRPGRHGHRYVDDYSAVMRAEKPCTKLLASFAPKPVNITIDIQANGEHILLMLRRHPITQLKWVAIAFLLSVTPWLVALSGMFAFLTPSYQFAILLGWYLAILGFSFKSFLKWFFHVYIITDERIIDVEFTSLLYKDVSTAKIENIEDITTVASGVMTSIFNYGTIIAQTSATKQEFSFEDVPQPSKVTTLLNELLLEEEREKLEGRVS
ncbi:MAG: hypothetical protein WAU07_04005 [Microgenomates group bacterium]